MACFGHQFRDRSVQFGTTDVLVSNDAFCINQISRGPVINTPFDCNRTHGAVFAIPEASPIDISFFGRGGGLFTIFITVDTDQDEGLVRQLFYERPLVWN